MKNYDDLQRFKEKTGTGAIDFKDMSAQNQKPGASNWAIVRQIAGGPNDTVLAQAGSATVHAPQVVEPGELDAAFSQLPPAQPVHQAAASVSISPSAVVPASLEAPAALRLAEEKTEAVSLLGQLAPAAQTLPPEPVLAPVPRTTSAPPERPGNARFTSLFAAKNTEEGQKPAKDLPLQSLLEKIASCR